MSCCLKSSGQTIVLTNRDRVRVRYEGDHMIAVIGPVTGSRYIFSAQERTAVVDPRDVLALLKSRYFRLEGILKDSANAVSDEKLA